MLTTLIEKHRPQIVLFGATAIGRDLAPRVASSMRRRHDGRLHRLADQRRHRSAQQRVARKAVVADSPAFGGNIIATIVNFDRWPQMATVREGVMRKADADASRRGQVIQENVEMDDTHLVLKLMERHVEPRKINLKGRG